MGKWLWLLFWLIIPQVLANLMTNENILRWFPALKAWGQILDMLCLAVYSTVFLKLASEEKSYRITAICGFAAVAVRGIVFLIGGHDAAESRTAIMLFPALVLALIAEYYEYAGHAAILQGVDFQLAENWKSLWKWYIGMFAAMLISSLVVLVSAGLGVAVLLAALIGSAIVNILKLVYLYRTVKLFRERNFNGL